MADPNPPEGNPLGASFPPNMNDPLAWMSRMWGPATFDPKELDKRIAELQAVAQWLDMNRTLLQTTIQTLMIQRNAIEAMHSMARSAQGHGAESAGRGASAISSPRPAAPTPQIPGFDPSVWWNALHEQFARVARDAMAQAPSDREPTPAARAGQKPPGP
jgi:hypothetical protein